MLHLVAHVWPVNLPVFLFNTGTWKGRIKESGIWNHRWQANVCMSGRDWGMELQVANVWSGRVLWLFWVLKGKVSLAENNGEMNSTLTTYSTRYVSAALRLHRTSGADRFRSNLCVNFNQDRCGSPEPSGADTQDFYFSGCWSTTQHLSWI